MKTFFPLIITFALTLGLTGCKSDDDVDHDTIGIVYELRNQNFEWTGDSYQISRTFINPLYDSDVLLIYKQVGTTNNGAPIWQQIPITFYLNDGHEVDYNFDFSKFDFVIYAGGTFDLTGSSYIVNQTFRVVAVPAAFGKNQNVDFSDYNSVINFFSIDDSNPVEL